MTQTQAAPDDCNSFFRIHKDFLAILATNSNYIISTQIFM